MGDHINGLFFSLRTRLIKIEDDLVDVEASSEQLSNLEAETNELILKKEKLLVRLNEAEVLQNNLDRRSKIVAAFLRKYLLESDYKSYLAFIKVKAQLILHAKHLERRQKLLWNLLSKDSSRILPTATPRSKSLYC